jgi:hypothetical protein
VIGMPEFEDTHCDSDEEYIPEEILEERMSGGEKQYFVKWLTYALSESTWEVRGNIASSKSVLAKWEAKSNKKPKQKPKPKVRPKRKPPKADVIIATKHSRATCKRQTRAPRQ